MILEFETPLAIKVKPARPAFIPPLKEAGQRWNPFLDCFSTLESSQTKSLLQELKNSDEDDSIILWYPSAGGDYTDVDSINYSIFPDYRQKKQIIPKIFVHTDQLEFIFDNCVGNGETLRFDNKWNAILKKEISSGDSKWIIHILIDNYEFLTWALKAGTKIQYLYTACDGVTTGMGAFPKFPISTFYVTKFYQSLGVHYHITEYSREFYQYASTQIIENLQKEEPKLLECHPEISEANSSHFPLCFIGLKEDPANFKSATRSALVIRHCKD